eukprot:TRINITY_DN30582_c0_g1_i1.p1 TRINITY_DN30582_c0_g1~~TRINITY_DN30582_c0_g1_i1.p1  ORF type:complete len:100 (-),score=24.87 TRINITY_DN30582_c0_g1_i1:195-494(-)
MKKLYFFIFCFFLVLLLTNNVLCKPSKTKNFNENESKLDGDFNEMIAGTPKIRKKRFFLPALSIANFLGVSPFSTPLIPSFNFVGIQLPLSQPKRRMEE